MAAAPLTLVTLATYNERENLPPLVAAIRQTVPGAHILVVDDNSPDGTGEVADDLAAADPHLHVIHRPGKLGLGTATLAAMRYAIDQGYAHMLNMDADFSHHPRYIPDLIAGMDRYDVTIGSRYVPGGGVRGWGWGRQFMSRGINLYARTLLGLRVRDTSGAFRCYRVEPLRRIDPAAVVSRGYSFQEEILFLCQRIGCRIGEVPIVFEDRRYGRSKINRHEAIKALWIIARLGLARVGGKGRRG